MIQTDDLLQVTLFAREYQAVTDKYPDATLRRRIHETIRRMIDRVVQDVIRTTSANLQAAAPRSIDDVRHHGSRMILMSDELRREHLELKNFLREHVYRHYRVLRMTTKARRVIHELFEVLMKDISLLPAEHHDAARRAEARDGTHGRARVVADYIAGMTDRYALLEHRRLFYPEARS